MAKRKHNTVLEYISHTNGIINRVGKTAHQQRRQRIFEHRDGFIKARAAFQDIVEDLFIHDPQFAEDVYQTLFHKGAIPNVGTIQQFELFGTAFGKGAELHDAVDNKFPALYESGAERSAHMFLLEAIQKDTTTFGGLDIAEIANKLYGFAEVFDGGGKNKIAISTNDLRKNHLTREDVEESMRYLIMAPRKKGFKTTFIPGGDAISQYGLLNDYGKGLKALDKINQEILKSESWFEGASMWVGVVPSSTGDGVEIAVMQGVKGDRYKSTMVGRMYEEGIENGKRISRPIRYKKDKMLKMFTTWRRGRFMDTENDVWETDSLKERIGEYYNKGPVPEPHIPFWFAQEIMDPREFEYNHVIKPFWEKNKNLSPEEFALKWDKVWREETYTQRDQIYDYFDKDVLNPREREPMFGVDSPLKTDINIALERTQKNIEKEEEKYARANL